MPRQKYQRPEVYPTGKRDKLWKAEYREYFIGTDGKEESRHKSATWSRANFTKGEAQKACDALLQKLQEGGPKADGSMSLAAFWEEIYYPVRSGKWAPNTRKSATSLWRLYIKPVFGSKRLLDITKAAIDLHLLKLAEGGMGLSMMESLYNRFHSILDEALENDFIPKNPARRVEIPQCRPKSETRSLTEDEVRRLWDKTEGREYLLWRLLVLAGPRIGEALALVRTDLIEDGLRISKSALNGRPAPTKNKKTRDVRIPASLRAELEEWLSTHPHSLLFTSPGGKMLRRSDIYVRTILQNGRAAAAIPDLTFRMCRTTFATLFEGDIKDAQAMLGHHSPTFTLQIYRKPIAARQQSSVEELDRRLKLVPKKGAA